MFNFTFYFDSNKEKIRNTQTCFLCLKTTSGRTRTCCWIKTYRRVGEPLKTQLEHTTGMFQLVPPSGSTPAWVRHHSCWTHKWDRNQKNNLVWYSWLTLAESVSLMCLLLVLLLLWCCISAGRDWTTQLQKRNRHTTWGQVSPPPTHEQTHTPLQTHLGMFKIFSSLSGLHGMKITSPTMIQTPR